MKSFRFNNFELIVPKINGENSFPKKNAHIMGQIGDVISIDNAIIIIFLDIQGCIFIFCS